MTIGLRAEGARGPLQPRVGSRRLPSPMPEYYDRLLDQLDLPPTPPDARLHTSVAEHAWMDEYLMARGIDPAADLVLLNPGASFGPSKLWLAERWVELARHYAAHRLTPIFLAGPAEVTMVREIAAAAGAHGMIDPVVRLDVLKALLERAALVVSTDTGPRHLALWMHRPTVCLMGPNDRRHTDYALDRQVVIQKDLPCVPCQQKVCPLGTGQCMADITVAEVISAGERARQLGASG
jgi:heptosyltransferase-2